MNECMTVTVGLDVHARSIRLAAVRADELLEERTLPYDEEAVERVLRRWPAVRCCYEAGPTGFGLQRHLLERGIECLVVARGRSCGVSGSLSSGSSSPPSSRPSILTSTRSTWSTRGSSSSSARSGRRLSRAPGVSWLPGCVACAGSTPCRRCSPEERSEGTLSLIHI